MKRKYTLSSLENAINGILSLDPDTPQKLLTLHGKVIKIILEPFNTHFFIRFNHELITLLEEYDGEANTTIQSNMFGFIRLGLLPRSKIAPLFSGRVKISGDLILGQEVKSFFDALDIDWEGHLAQFTGDVIAHQTGALVKHCLRFKKQLHNTTCDNLSAYLQEELRTLPPREEINDFFHDVDQVRLDADRVEAYINQLKSHHESN